MALLERVSCSKVSLLLSIVFLSCAASKHSKQKEMPVDESPVVIVECLKATPDALFFDASNTPGPCSVDHSNVETSQPLSTTIYKYNKARQLITSVETMVGSKEKLESRYKYDADGRLQSVQLFGSMGALVWSERIAYGEIGLEVSRVRSAAHSVEKRTGVLAPEYSFSLHSEYSQNEMLAKWESGTRKRTTVSAYTCEPSGKLRKVVTETDQGEHVSTREFLYDSIERLVEVVEDFGEGNIKKTEYSYDESGEPLKKEEGQYIWEYDFACWMESPCASPILI